jgi:methionine-rich copper-binding protein CopC
MNRKTLTLAILALVASAAAAFAPHAARAAKHDDDDRYFSVQDQETIRKTFTLSATHKALDVDNIFGSIEVVGTDSNEIQLVVTRTNRAETQQKLDLAKKVVTLDVNQQADSLTLYVNGPFRCNNYRGGCGGCGDYGCGGCNGCDRDQYQVKIDFQLQVPRSIDVDLRTVTSGHVRVENISGHYSVHNVNGPVEMLRVAGSGSAGSVNGSVKVTFAENPRENSRFNTINGSVELYFAKNLSADFRFKTMNGGIYTDYQMTSLPVRAMKEEHEGTRVIFRADRSSGARVGSGGPEISAENLNGNIRILENHE